MPLNELARRIGATLAGDGSLEITGCAAIERAGPDEVTFLANERYARYLKTTGAGAVIVAPGTQCPPGMRQLVVDDPYYGFRNAMIALHGFRVHPDPFDGGADGAGRAGVHSSASIGPGSIVHPYAVVEAEASLGRDCVLYPGAYVGPQARLGEGCVLYPNAVVYDRCVLGDRVTLHANTVIGQDGFGYATHGGAHHKIPQVGIVVVEDDVEMGAGCAIERAAIGETRIGRGSKLADLISIGHGTRIGAHCLLVSLVGVSGSVEVGDFVVLGGQVGVAGHLKIGEGVQAAGRAAIVQNVPAGARVAGVPAVDLEQSKRNYLVSRDLAGLARRVRQLEKGSGVTGQGSGKKKKDKGSSGTR